MVWSPSSKGVFEVRSCYQSMIPVDTIVFPCKQIWKTKAPPRVTFFTWSVALGKILMGDNLRKRNFIEVWCCLCKNDGDTVHHLLLHCRFAFDLRSFFSMMRLHWMMLCTIKELLCCWSVSFGNRRMRVI